jgi:RNA polymerase sigma factor (sigma-70 family)
MDRFDFDDDYVRRLLAGDREVQEHFYRYFRQAMLVWLYKQRVRPDDVDDVIQTTFARVVAALPLRDNRALGSYVRNTVLNVYREQVRDNVRHERADAVSPAETEEDDVIRRLIEEEDARVVRDVIGGMKGRDGELLRAYYLEELSRDEACRKCGVEPRNFNVALCRARKKFKEHYERKKKKPPAVPSMIFVTLGRLWSLWL